MASFPPCGQRGYAQGTPCVWHFEQPHHSGNTTPCPAPQQACCRPTSDCGCSQLYLCYPSNGAGPNPCPPIPPEPGTPSIACMASYTVYLNQTATMASLAIIPNAFNSNDGTPPFTIDSVEIVGIQALVDDVTITPQGNDVYQLTGLVEPLALVQYTDSADISRSKFIPLFVSASATFTSPVPTATLDFVSYINSATTGTPSLVGDTLSFSYEVNYTLLGISGLPLNLPVVENAQAIGPLPGYLPTHEAQTLAINSICDLTLSFGPYTTGIIPFVATGIPPYTVTAFTPGPGVTVINAFPGSGYATEFDVAFPVSITVSSSDSVISTQASLMYVTFPIAYILPYPGQQFLLQLDFQSLGLPQVLGNIIEVTSGTIIGTVAQTEAAPATRTLADFVQCSPLSIEPCTVPISPTTIPTPPD